MHHPVHKTLKAAYSFYNVSNKTGWLDLMNDALVAARNVSETIHFIFLAFDKTYFSIYLYCCIFTPPHTQDKTTVPSFFRWALMSLTPWI